MRFLHLGRDGKLVVSHIPDNRFLSDAEELKLREQRSVNGCFSQSILDWAHQVLGILDWLYNNCNPLKFHQ